jgi:hypothetical protein
MDDTLSPKYIGLQNCVFIYNTDTTTVDVNEYIEDSQTLTIYPVPSINGFINVEHSLNEPNIYLYDNSGRSINFSVDDYKEKGLVLNVYGYRGFAVLLLNEKDNFISKKILFIN